MRAPLTGLKPTFPISHSTTGYSLRVSPSKPTKTATKPGYQTSFAKPLHPARVVRVTVLPTWLWLKGRALSMREMPRGQDGATAGRVQNCRGQDCSKWEGSIENQKPLGRREGHGSTSRGVCRILLQAQRQMNMESFLPNRVPETVTKPRVGQSAPYENGIRCGAEVTPRPSCPRGACS